MKIVFMGTPDFAAGALESLVQAGHEILLVVTQPDRPRGRSGQPQPSPVKECAMRHDIPVFQPERIRRPEAVAELEKYPADPFVVAAFGQILTKEILDMPRLGCLNIHASLLPKYRGASPIQHALLDGEKQTGITIMQMDEGIDTGDMLHKAILEIAPDETFETLHDKLMDLGGKAIVTALSLLENGGLTPTKQRDDLSCYAPLIKKTDGLLDFTKETAVIDRTVRAMNPWPGAYTFLKGKTLKIYRGTPTEGQKGDEPGTIAEVGKNYFDIATVDGRLRVTELQLEGKKRMSTESFLLGNHLEPGTALGQ
jgi:methionyl-tRNA formyltransferase